MAGLENGEGAKVVDLVGGGATVVEELGDVNTGDPAILTDFIVDGIERHSNDNYALVISGHGAAWPGVGGDESTEGNDYLQLAALPTPSPRAWSRPGWTGSGPLRDRDASGTQDEITLSMIDLTKMAALDEAVAELSAATTESAADVASAVGRGRANNLGFGRSPDPVEQPDDRPRTARDRHLQRAPDLEDRPPPSRPASGTA